MNKRKIITSLDHDKLVNLAKEGLNLLIKSMESILYDIEIYYTPNGRGRLSALEEKYDTIKERMEYFGIPTSKYDAQFRKMTRPEIPA